MLLACILSFRMIATSTLILFSYKKNKRNERGILESYSCWNLAFRFADDRGGLFRCRLLHLPAGKVLPCLSDSFLPPTCKCIVRQSWTGSVLSDAFSSFRCFQSACCLSGPSLHDFWLVSSRYGARHKGHMHAFETDQPWPSDHDDYLCEQKEEQADFATAMQVARWSSTRREGVVKHTAFLLTSCAYGMF